MTIVRVTVDTETVDALEAISYATFLACVVVAWTRETESKTEIKLHVQHAFATKVSKITMFIVAGTVVVFLTRLIVGHL